MICVFRCKFLFANSVFLKINKVYELEADLEILYGSAKIISFRLLRLVYCPCLGRNPLP